MVRLVLYDSILQMAGAVHLFVCAILQASFILHALEASLQLQASPASLKYLAKRSRKGIVLSVVTQFLHLILDWNLAIEQSAGQ